MADDAEPREIGYRVMNSDDIPAGLRLCRMAHWNQTERDWELFLALSPGGCRVAVRDGRVIGTVATVCYDDRFSWIGMVLVDTAERGKGIGSRLMSEAIECLSEMPSIRLDATPAGHPVYRRLDFVDEYRLSRMEATSPETESTIEARPMRPDDLPAIAGYDREIFGADRLKILEWMLAGAPEYARVVETGGGISGFAFGRHGFNFEHIGPVVAADEGTARVLVSSCLNRMAGRRVIIDVPQNDPNWMEWLAGRGFSEQRPFIRMYRGGNPYPGRPDLLFAVLGPEFG